MKQHQSARAPAQPKPFKMEEEMMHVEVFCQPKSAFKA
jgi:hypothetical protein